MSRRARSSRARCQRHESSDLRLPARYSTQSSMSSRRRSQDSAGNPSAAADQFSIDDTLNVVPGVRRPRRRPADLAPRRVARTAPGGAAAHPRRAISTSSKSRPYTPHMPGRGAAPQRLEGPRCTRAQLLRPLRELLGSVWPRPRQFSEGEGVEPLVVVVEPPPPLSSDGA